MTNKNLSIALAVVLLVSVGAYFFPQVQQSFGSSAAGSTFNTAKYAGIAINLTSPGSNATSSSILNTDANDRFITAEKVGCELVGTSKTINVGAGLASLTLTMATSSTANPVVNANTNTLPVITVATSTPNFVVASSTAGTPGNNLVGNIWAAGSYLSIFSNATNTAACTAGVDYIAS